MTAVIVERPQLAVSAGIFRDGRCLLVQRARSPGNGLWSFPGGRVEFGETLHEAVVREVMEETGLEIDVYALSGWREAMPATAGGGHYLVMSFAALWRAGEPQLNEELADYRWIDGEIPDTMKTTTGLSEVMHAARRIIATT